MPVNDPSRLQQWKSALAKIPSALGSIVKSLGGTVTDFFVVATPKYILRNPYGSRYGDGLAPEALLLEDS